MLSLRSKSILALALTCLLSGLLAGAIGWQAVGSIRHYLGTSLARNLTLLNRERILSPVLRELALSERLAQSQSVREWLLDESNSAKKTLALREAESFRRDFADRSYFLISALTNHYYFNDDKAEFSAKPRYRLVPGTSRDAWFFSTVENTDAFNINVDVDIVLGVTKVWFNVLVKDGGRKIGLAGSGLDFSDFLRHLVSRAEPGVTPVVADANGAIQVHPDGSLIAYNSATKQPSTDRSVYGLLQDPRDVGLARNALANAAAHPGEVELFEAAFQGKPHVIAVSYIPELKWHVLTAVDLAVTQLVEVKPLVPALLSTLVLLLSVGVGFSFTTNRLIFRPLSRLTLSARAMAGGNYGVALPPSGSDEIGALTDAFASMVAKVQRHTEELEDTVRQRTQELLLANREIAAAHQQIRDSIAYASLIQRAILPERQLTAAFDDRHFVLWRPRDVVGGDFYVFRQEGNRYLLGIADCAGHGVPGACMTMLGYAAVNQAVGEVGMHDPAGILERTDRFLRTMLSIGPGQQQIATHVEAGLVYIDLAAGNVSFAGAKIALHWSDGEETGCVRGARRALAEQQPGRFANETFPLRRNQTFYLATDGFLDQNGGEKGFGFGTTRFADLIRQQAGKSIAEQKRLFESALADWQRDNPQRDDITLLCFRCAGPNPDRCP